IENIIYSHYDGISNQNYSAAYDYFSDSKKEEYSLADWQDGLEDTIEDIVDYVEVDNISGVEAKASLGMTSYEEDGDDILRSEEHTSELQSRFDLVCRLLLEKKK